MSTPVSSPRVPNKVTLAPSLRVPNKDAISLPLHGPVNTQDSSSQRVATHPQHRYPTRHNTGLPHQAKSGIIIPYHWANAIIDPISGASMEYRHLVKIPKHRVRWITSFSKELGRLAQGVGDRIMGTNTIYFIDYALIPKERCSDITYGRILVDYCPHKTEPNRTRLTVRGNLINYPGDVSTPPLTPQHPRLSSTVPSPHLKPSI